jgi:prepilin peptidase CpaA
VTSQAHIAILQALLAVACASDVARRRVPNAIVAALAAGGLAARWAGGGVTAAAWGAAAGAGVLALLLPAWATGKLGGGDAKLAAAAAVWLGPSRLIAFLVLSAAAGLPVALATWVARRLELRRLARGGAAAGAEAKASSPRETVPFAVAIAMGALLAMPWSAP